MPSENDDDVSDLESSLGQLVLDKEESESPVWKQLLRENGALAPEFVKSPESNESQNQQVSDVKQTNEAASPEGKPSVRIPELREYQKELTEVAMDGTNTLIYAPTGSGKTIVALHIIQNHLKNRQGSKVAFLARTVPLAVQQFELLNKLLPEYQVINITGKSKGSMKLHHLYRWYDVFVMTPMILVNHLNKGDLADICEFSMVMFDECHHTQKGEPYMHVMYSYLETKLKQESVKKLPQIIGLTASVGIGNAKSVPEAKDGILKLCANLDAAAVSTVVKNKEDLDNFVPKPHEERQCFPEPKEDECVKRIVKIMCQLEDQAKIHAKELSCSEEMGCIPKDRKSQKYVHWVHSLNKVAKIAPILDAEPNIKNHARLLMIISEYLKSYSMALEIYELVDAKAMVNFLDKRFEADETNLSEEPNFFNDFKELQKFATAHTESRPNLEILAEALEKHIIKKGQLTRGIVFVRTRALAKALVTWLETCSKPEMAALNASVFTSANVAESRGGISQERQEMAMDEFRSGKRRLLVATSVAEEGLDIPACNLVIKYNYVLNEISAVQIRGRSRAADSVSVLVAFRKTIGAQSENEEKIRWMEAAIKLVSKMNRSEIGKYVEEEQNRIMKTHSRTTKKENQPLFRVPFKMVCSLCKTVGVKSSDIRLLNGNHRISLDRDFLEHIQIIPYQDPEYHDEVHFAGEIYCKFEPAQGKRCKQKLGTLIRHARNPFMALRVKSFVFQIDSKAQPTAYKQWKKVPFVVEDLSNEDIDRYEETSVARASKRGHDAHGVAESTGGTNEAKRSKPETYVRSNGGDMEDQNQAMLDGTTEAETSKEEPSLDDLLLDIDSVME